MTLVFFLLSAALLLLAVLLLWFVPHLLGQQELRAAREAQRLRELLSDVLGEQEAVALRQVQLGTSLSHLQDQLEQMHTAWPATVEEIIAQPAEVGRPLLEHLDQRLAGLQGQLEGWLSERKGRLQTLNTQENESWAYVMGLLGTMQDELGSINSRGRRNVTPAEPTPLAAGGGSRLANDLRDEMESLRMISEEVAALQWRLQRNLHSSDSANGDHTRQEGSPTTLHSTRNITPP